MHDLPYTLVDWRDVAYAVPADDLESLCESVADEHEETETTTAPQSKRLPAR